MLMLSPFQTILFLLVDIDAGTDRGPSFQAL